MPTLMTYRYHIVDTNTHVVPKRHGIGAWRWVTAIGFWLLGINIINAQCPFSSLGYAYEKTITIDHLQVSGSTDLIDFPVLISLTDPNLATVPNGGHVENANGWDIVFTEENGNKLDHEIESYDPTSGKLIAWVRIPKLSSTINTDIKILYGNQFVSSTNENHIGVWGSGYVGVWHLGNTNDATSYNNSGSAVGNAAVTANGYIGSAFTFDGSGDYVSVPDNSSLELSSTFTLSAWINPSVINNWNRIIAKSYTSNNLPYTIYGMLFNGTHKIRMEISKSSTQQTLDGATDINIGQWAYITLTYDGTTRRIFVNGVPDGSSTSVTGAIDNDNMPLTIGASGYNLDYFNGKIDEARVSSVAKSPDWISTEYNNQHAPSSFYSISGESVHSIFTLNTCSSDSAVYSIPNLFTSYNWNITNGTIVKGNGTSSIKVLWNTTTPQTLSLSVTNTLICTKTSETLNVTVTPTSVGGSISGSTTICEGNSTGTLTLSGNTGSVVKWQKRLNAGAWTDIANTSTTYSEIPSSAGTWDYQAIVQSGTCSSTTSSLATIIVDPTSVGGSISGSTTICEGNSTGTLTLSGNTGSVVKWQKRLNAG
ncbi:MAG TPA: DUF2341 domain-containing protein, partial [Bacteroidales bacterium]